VKLPIHIKTVKRLRETLDTDRRNGLSIGFVPTMGFLHDGHASLMRRATADCDRVVASIFVNPLQFAANEDLEDYPRDLQRDTEVAGNAGVDYLFIPSVEEMYPDWPVKTEVRVPELAAHWDGASRPTHFTGVATVVSKLFNMVGPCNAYFGRKDFQQLVIIRRMVKDLSFPILVTGCPTIREQDGLAMSSRNTYLSAEDRAAAVVLNQALQAGTSENHEACRIDDSPRIKGYARLRGDRGPGNTERSRSAWRRIIDFGCVLVWQDAVD